MSIHRRLVSRPVLAAVALLGGAGLVRPTPASADAPAGDRRFMVMPFENLSSVHQIVDYQLPDAGGKHAGKNFAQVDRFCEAPREDLEELISNSVPGVSIVERQRADSILQEQEFGGLKGVSDPDKAVAAGKLVGANTIAIGTIDQIASSVKEFHGDGIDVIDRTTTASVHIRIIDIEQGIVIAQKRFKGDNMVRLSSRGDKVDIDSEFDAVKAALDKVKDDPAFLAKIGGGAAATPVATVKVNITSTPSAADVSVDGNFVGNTPTPVDLPQGKKSKITLHKAGYKDWEASLIPREGMNVAPELEKKDAADTATGNDVTIHVTPTAPNTQPPPP